MTRQEITATGGSHDRGGKPTAHTDGKRAGGADGNARIKLGIAAGILVLAGVAFALPYLSREGGPSSAEAAAAAQAAKINEAVSGSVQNAAPPEPSREGLMERVPRRPMERPQ